MFCVFFSFKIGLSFLVCNQQIVFASVQWNLLSAVCDDQLRAIARRTMMADNGDRRHSGDQAEFTQLTPGAGQVIDQKQCN